MQQVCRVVIYRCLKTPLHAFLHAPFKGFVLFLKMRHAGDNVNKQADPRVPYSAYNIIPHSPSKHVFFRNSFPMIQHVKIPKPRQKISSRDGEKEGFYWKSCTILVPNAMLPNCFLSDQKAPPHDMVRFFIRFYDGVAQFVSKIFPSKDVPRVPKGFKLKTRAWGSRSKSSLLMKIHNIMTSPRIVRHPFAKLKKLFIP